jgi:hypothetical protein
MHNKHARANVADYVLQSSALSCRNRLLPVPFFFHLLFIQGRDEISVISKKVDRVFACIFYWTIKQRRYEHNKLIKLCLH